MGEAQAVGRRVSVPPVGLHGPAGARGLGPVAVREGLGLLLPGKEGEAMSKKCGGPVVGVRKSKHASGLSGLELEVWEVIDGTLHPVPYYECRGCREAARRVAAMFTARKAA